MLNFVKNVRSRLLASTATAFIAALAMGGTVAALTSSSFIYSPLKTGYFSIHPMALGPDRTSSTTFYLNHYFNGHLFSGNDGCFTTGVNLPHGSRITQLAVWYQSPAGSELFVYFHRTRLSDGATGPMIPAGALSDDTNTRKLAVIPLSGTSILVSNTGYAYAFGFCPGAGGAFSGARIAYAYNNAGD